MKRTVNQSRDMSAETLLAIDFSTSFRSIAIMEMETRRVLARVDTETGLTGPVPGAVPSEGICACVDRLLDQLHLDNCQVDTLAVGVGPGSYTGIRAAIAFAQGWNLATGLKLAAVSTADALALRALRLGWRGEIEILIDAQRNEFYHAVYQTGTDADPIPRLVKPLCIISQTEALERVKNSAQVGGPDLGRLLPEAKPLYPHAEDLAVLALERKKFIEPEAMEPIYLRPVQFVKVKNTRALPL